MDWLIPPCEREWTDEERDEFYAREDHGIFYESTKSYEASQALQLAREIRVDSRRTTRLLIWAFCALMVLGSWAVVYMWKQVPAAYDVPGVEVQR